MVAVSVCNENIFRTKMRARLMTRTCTRRINNFMPKQAAKDRNKTQLVLESQKEVTVTQNVITVHQSSTEVPNEN